MEVGVLYDTYGVSEHEKKHRRFAGAFSRLFRTNRKISYTYCKLSAMTILRCADILHCYGNVGCADLAAVLGIALGIESNLLALLQRLEALSVDGGEMYEYLLAGSIVGDEAITLLCVKPLNCAVVHFSSSLISMVIVCNVIPNLGQKNHIFL